MKILELTQRQQTDLENRRSDVQKYLRRIDDDIRQDLGMSPNAHLPLVKCPKCPLDITDFTEDELNAHAAFHRHMAEAPSFLWSPEPVTERTYPEAYPEKYLSNGAPVSGRWV